MATNTYPKVPPLQNKFLTVEIPDISTADQRYVTPGFSGKIVNIYSALNDAISGADADLTAKIGGTAVTGGLITVAQSGSASGDVDSATPTAKNFFTAAEAIEIETDGASTDTAAVVVTFELQPV